MIVNKEYVTQKGLSCILGCVANYLSFAKIDLSETDMFFKVRGYELKENELGKLRYQISILDDPGELNISYTQKVCNNAEEAKKELIRLVEAEEKVSILMRASKLKYDTAFKYAESSVVHCVNVIGYNGTDEFYFSDGYIANFKGSTFNGYVAFEDFLEAWSDFQFIYMVLDTDQLIRDGYTNYTPDIKELVQSQKNNNESYKKFILKEFLESRALLNTKEFEKKILGINNQIRISGFLTVKTYYLELLKNRYLNSELIEGYSAILKTWNVISCLMIKLAYDNEERELDEIIERIKNAFETEEKLLSEMEKL